MMVGGTKKNNSGSLLCDTASRHLCVCGSFSQEPIAPHDAVTHGAEGTSKHVPKMLSAISHPVTISFRFILYILSAGGCKLLNGRRRGKNTLGTPLFSLSHAFMIYLYIRYQMFEPAVWQGGTATRKSLRFWFPMHPGRPGVRGVLRRGRGRDGQLHPSGDLLRRHHRRPAGLQHPQDGGVFRPVRGVVCLAHIKVFAGGNPQ